MRLLQKMGQIEPDPGKRSWYRMFKHMDDDGSGRITYYELVDMVRTELTLALTLAFTLSLPLVLTPSTSWSIWCATS